MRLANVQTKDRTVTITLDLSEEGIAAVQGVALTPSDVEFEEFTTAPTHCWILQLWGDQAAE